MQKMKMTKSERVDKYRKINVRQYVIRYSRLSSSEIVDYLDSLPSYQCYIKELIEKDINNKKRNQEYESRKE